MESNIYNIKSGVHRPTFVYVKGLGAQNHKIAEIRQSGESEIQLPKDTMLLIVCSLGTGHADLVIHSSYTTAAIYKNPNTSYTYAQGSDDRHIKIDIGVETWATVYALM